MREGKVPRRNTTNSCNNPDIDTGNRSASLPRAKSRTCRTMSTPRCTLLSHQLKHALARWIHRPALQRSQSHQHRPQGVVQIVHQTACERTDRLQPPQLLHALLQPSLLPIPIHETQIQETPKASGTCTIPRSIHGNQNPTRKPNQATPLNAAQDPAANPSAFTGLARTIQHDNPTALASNKHASIPAGIRYSHSPLRRFIKAVA